MLRSALCVLCFLCAAPAVAQDFARADRPRQFEFPRDHAAHPEFATEWWYFTGAVRTEAGSQFGYQLTFFRVALSESLATDASPWRARDWILAHLAVTDVAAQRFATRERVRRALPEIAGASADSLFLFAGSWRVTASGERFELRAGDDQVGLELSLEAIRPPLLQGEGGRSIKDREGRNASYYYSLPRLRTHGTLQLEGERHDVAGESWMDHEFFSGDTPADGLGWDWFSFHAEDGSDLMLYRVRHPEHGDFAFGSCMLADGSVRSLDTERATWTARDFWSSPSTGTRYPIGWELELPAESLRLRTHALVESQEIDARRSVGFAYWEGLSAATLEWHGRRLQAIGYVELTGY